MPASLRLELDRQPGARACCAASLAVDGAESAAGWLQLVLQDCDPGDALRGECAGLLEYLFVQTWQQLAERQSEFKPLLPADEASTLVRAEAMGAWCEGFLHGLVSGAGAAKFCATSWPRSRSADIIQATCWKLLAPPPATKTKRKQTKPLIRNYSSTCELRRSSRIEELAELS